MEYSFSRLSAFDNCKHEFYLNYIKECGSCQYYDEENEFCENQSCIFFGPQEKSFCCNCHRPYYRQDNAFAQSGSLFHEIMEHYAKGNLTLEELPGLYEDYFDEYVTERFPPNKYVDLRERYKEGGTNFLLGFMGFDDLYTVLGAELHFSIPFTEGNTFQGFIDLILWDKEKNEIVIVDYKSKAEFKSKEEKKEYARQLYLYSLWVQSAYTPHIAKLVFVHFRTGENTVIDFKQEDLEEAVTWAKNRIQEIESETEFKENKDRFYCSYLCNFRDSCKRKDDVNEG